MCVFVLFFRLSISSTLVGVFGRQFDHTLDTYYKHRFYSYLVYKLYFCIRFVSIYYDVYVTGKVESWALCTITEHCVQCPISKGKVGIS